MNAHTARLFAALRSREENGHTDGFVLPGTTSVRSLAGFYGFTCPAAGQDMSIGEYVTQMCGGVPRVGYGTAWDRAELVVGEIEGGVVRKVRLRILPLRDRRMLFDVAPVRAPKRRLQDRAVASR